MSLQEAQQYIKDFMLIQKPTHAQLERFKLALKIAATLQKPN